MREAAIRGGLGRACLESYADSLTIPPGFGETAPMRDAEGSVLAVSSAVGDFAKLFYKLPSSLSFYRTDHGRKSRPPD